MPERFSAFVKLQIDPNLNKKISWKKSASWYRCLVFITKADSSEAPGETCQCCISWLALLSPLPALKCIMEPGTSQQTYRRGANCKKECLHGTVDTWQLQGPHVLRKTKSSTLTTTYVATFFSIGKMCFYMKHLLSFSQN